MTILHECGAEIAVGTFLCPRCGVIVDSDREPEVSVPEGTVPGTTALGDGSAPVHAEQPPAVACPLCGRIGAATLQVCEFCGTPLTVAAEAPVPDPSQASNLSAIRVVLLRLPNGDCVELFDGVGLVLGRNSGDPRTRAALAPLDTVSGRHARVELREGRLVVTDLGSTNGTLVNGNEIIDRIEVELTSQIDIGLGRSVTVQVVGSTQAVGCS